MTRFLSIVLLSFCTILTAQADIYSASSALSRGDYETAVKEFTRLAEKGDDNAQANLGYMYYAGEGVPQDYEKAVYWYRKSATQGNKDAQYNLAVSYAFGEGTKQDLTEAAIWYRRAGEQNHVVSQYSLAISYAYGEGVPQDLKEAARWFKKAAEQGYARAQVHLGSMHHTGEGVAQDYAEAVRWYRMAADRGDATAQYNLGAMFRSGKGVEQNYAQAKRWFRQSADQGYAAAQNELASLERSAAANVATRTIQAKPELPIVKETLPEPTPTKKTEPVEKVAVQKTEPEEPIQTTTQETSESSKKPLFSVEKEGLLSIDESELDIAETKKTIEPETEVVATKTEPAVVETPAEIPEINETEAVVEIDEEDVGTAGKNTWNVGEEVEAPSEYETTESSGGFIDKLFSKKERLEPEPVIADTESMTEEQTVIETEEEIATVSEPESNTSAIHNALGLPTPTEAEDSESSDGFFKKLFSKKENSKADIAETETIIETTETDEAVAEIEQAAVETPAEIPEINETEPVVEIAEEKVGTAGESTWDVSDAKAPSEYKTSESSGSFFDKLFSKKESSEPEPVIAETETIVDEPTEETEQAIVKTNDDEAVGTAGKSTWDVEETKSEETVVADNNWADTTTESSVEEDEESEPSGGLFSAIGNIFSNKNKDTESEIVESKVESDDVLIAKVEEPIQLVEEIELAEEAETDLSQYSVRAGRRALSNHDYDKALKQFKPLAEAGNNEAQSHLGSLYYVGKGVTKDLNEAYNWYRKSADQGNVDAQYSIGNMYLLGEGVEQNNASAEEWYTLASEQGHISAKNNLNSLKKLESLNRENQLKQEAIAEEQKAKEEVIPEVVEEPEEIATLVEDATEAEAVPETILEEEKKSGLLGLLGGLFESKPPEEKEVSQDIETEIIEATPEAESEPEAIEVEVVDHGLPELNIDMSSIDDASSTETLANEEVIEESQITNSSEEEVEQSNSIASTNETQSSTSESPTFFKSLFGSNDVKKTNTEDNLELEPSEEIESINIDSVKAEEPVIVETEAEDIQEVVSGSEDNLAETTEEQVISEKSGGLFGFIGNIFSSEKDNETDIIDNTVSETPEEVAMLDTDTETDQTSINIDEPIIEELAEDVTSSKIERLRPLAIQGDQEAQYELGALYYSGDSVKQDYSQAALWYRRAAQQGDADAQYSLGNMFLMGEGVTQDDNQARHWYTLAAEQGHSSSKNNLESLKSLQKIEYNSPQVEIDTTTNSDQLISLDDEQSSQATAIEDTTGKAEYEQGLAYAFGDGVAQNDRTAFNLFYEAAEKGYVLAQYKLGVCFAYGEGVRQDQKKAAEWYRKAAEQGYTIAQRNLATMYLDGKGVEQNKVQALAWYQVVASAGNAMDLRRRDTLKSELSEIELSESEELSKQITSRLTNPSL
jgi:TPR repeat protein/predicted secreted protein